MSQPMNIGPAGERDHAKQFKTLNLLTCPYDETHKILPCRISIHLKRCRIQHPFSGLEVCQFSHLHHVPADEMDTHKTTCEYRINVVNTLIEHPDQPVNAPPEVPHIPCEEDWGDSNSGTYEPEKANANKVLLIHGRGLAKNERRIYRENQRIRNSILMNKNKETESKKDSS